tara:strand:+ start:733 stop:1149 length:417 start_codon:yes stop_codon:yes gene_type:complete
MHRLERHRSGSLKLLYLSLAAVGLAGCQQMAGSPFPQRQTAVAATALEACPDWREVRISHPLDLLHGNPMPSRDQRFGCATATNLRRQVADPGDLESPGEGGRALAPASSRYASGALQRYYDDKVKPLPERKSAVGGS